MKDKITLQSLLFTTIATTPMIAMAGDVEVTAPGPGVMAIVAIGVISAIWLAKKRK